MLRFFTINPPNSITSLSRICHDQSIDWGGGGVHKVIIGERAVVKTAVESEVFLVCKACH